MNLAPWILALVELTEAVGALLPHIRALGDEPMRDAREDCSDEYQSLKDAWDYARLLIQKTKESVGV